MDTVLLVLRVRLSLAAVLGLMWWLGRRMQARVGSKRRESLNVLGRQQLSRHSGVALIEAAGHRIVVGYGDDGVTFLHDAGEVPDEAPAALGEARVELDVTGFAHQEATVSELRVVDADSTTGAIPSPVRSTSARTADAQRHRSPLEGSILAPDTWRKAVATVQERTVRRP